MLVLVSLTGWETQVIAAPLIIDQSAEVSESAQALDQPMPPVPVEATPPETAAPRRQLGLGNVIMFVLAVGCIALFFALRWHRLRSAPNRPAPFPASLGFGLFIIMWLLGKIGAGAAAAQFGDAQAISSGQPLTLQQTALMMLGAYAGQAIAVGIFLWLTMRASPADRSSRLGTAKAAAFGAGALLLAWPVVHAAGALTAWITRAPDDPIAHDTLRLLLDAPHDGWYLLMVLLVVIGAPVMEEVMYRGLLQRSLVFAGLGHWAAIALTSGIFALQHVPSVPPHALTVLFVLAAAFGWAYERTGRLVAPIVMHMLFNAGNLTLAQFIQ